LLDKIKWIDKLKEKYFFMPPKILENRKMFYLLNKY
jgi:hypothetical protein